MLDSQSTQLIGRERHSNSTPADLPLRTHGERVAVGSLRTRHASWVLGFIVGLLWLSAQTSRADRVILRAGTEVAGDILTSDSERLFIRTEGGELGIAHDRITSVVLESEAVTAVRAGLLDLVGGRTATGLETWAGAAGTGDPEAVKELGRELVERQDDVLRGIRDLASSEGPRAIQALTRVAQTETLAPDARYTALRGLVALGSREPVADLLKGPLGYQLAGDAITREFMVGFWRVEVRRRLATQEHLSALEAIENLRQVDEGAGRSQRALWTLSRIGEARDQGDVLEALRLAVEELWPLMPQVARNRAAVLLTELPDWATTGTLGIDRRFEAARSYLETDLRKIMPLEAEGALEDLLLARGQSLLGDGRTTDVLRLLQSSPLTGSRERLKALAVRAEFLQKKANLDPKDPMGLYRLGEWAAEHGRQDWALDSFWQCLRYDDLRPLAEAQIRIVRNEVESKALEQAIARYREGDRFGALEALTPILERDQTGAPSPFHDEAERMASLIRRELHTESTKRPYQAEVLFQQAERAFFAGDHETAIRKLADVLRKYGDTPAAERADQLLPRVLRQVEIDQMEGRQAPSPEIPDDLRERVPEDRTRLDDEIRTLLDAMREK